MEKTARAAYYAYCAYTPGMNEIIPWNNLSKQEQAKWYSVAEAVLRSKDGLSFIQLESDE